MRLANSFPFHTVVSVAFCIGTLAVTFTPAFAQAFDDRDRLAASGARIVVAAEADVPAAISPDWLRSPDSLVSTNYSGHPGAVAVTARYGQIKSTAGSMLVMGTGLVEGPPARPGSDLRSFDGSALDAELVLRFDPPPGARHLSFRYQFLTAEYPEFALPRYADALSVRVVDADGERTVLHETAADARLHPIAASSVAGSPMDIYSATVGALHGDFRLGRPAAGTTGWRQVSVPVSQNGPVDVAISLRDGGDGLVDSTALIESLDLRALQLELPDRAPITFGRGGVPEALDCIFQGGIVQGAVADGVTPINFIFFGLSGPGTVVYSFVNGQAPEDGGYDVVGGDQRLDTISVQTVLGPNGWESVAQYLVPEEFNRGGDEELGNRFVNLRVDFFPDNPDDPPVGATLPFNLLRPALILMHGLWSNATTWNGSPLMTDARLRTRPGDYRPTHAARFSRNTTRPATPIREACQALRADGIATTQFDYVGHSMGGIIGRNFDALVPDLINKFFTVNTPHTGSPLGNLVVFIRDNVISQLFFEQALLDWLRENELAIDEGALDDLSLGSAAINSITQTTIPSHALVGIGGSDLVGDALALAPGNLGVLFKILNFFDDTTDLFAGIQHDFIVGRFSQEGGISASATTVFDGLDSIHTRAPRSSAYAARIVDLLNTSADSSSFGTFPPPATLNAQGSLPKVAPARFSGTDDIVLNLPGGATAAPGDSVTVGIESFAGFDLQRALVVSRFDAVVLDGEPFIGIIELPEDFIGTLELHAFGQDSAGVFTAIAAPIAINVVTDSALTGLTIANADILLFEFDDLRQVYVFGTFDDGEERQITDPGTGTVYSSADPTIASISAHGIVTGLSPGITTLTAANAGFQDSISVEVVNGQVVFVDGFE